MQRPYIEEWSTTESRTEHANPPQYLALRKLLSACNSNYSTGLPQPAQCNPALWPITEKQTPTMMLASVNVFVILAESSAASLQ
ncbi:hypothetical protein CA54_06210 [Symmachiella macrocystis]|uniref:Uncharacterized protein n=1 Tax=Symmachiella macrocystis TaxID=2527985 RepID=A0A5C6BII1_9PLAN|nr:hypothetical protein CA54_06210 [Symmachiella macrocystis]